MRFKKGIIFFSFIIFSCNDAEQEKKLKELELKLEEQNEKIQQQKIESLEDEIEKKNSEIESMKSSNNLNPPSKNNYNYYGRYPVTSVRHLNYQDISNLNTDELKIMRNEIFARHGYIFKTQDLSAYFNAQSWYRPLYSDVSSKLTEIEKYNIDFIKKHE